MADVSTIPTPAQAMEEAPVLPPRVWAVGGWIWGAGTVLVAAIVAIPILSVVIEAFSPSDNIWSHLVDTVLSHYVITTVLLMIGVGLGTIFGGVATAWLVTLAKFPGKRIFEWALLLPLAAPAYVVAYVYTDLLEYAGPVQGMLRDLFGWQSPQDYWFPNIRSLGGAIFVMTLVLYPYVYVLARTAFLNQSVGVLEVSRTLGKGPWRTFFSVAFPLARPAIVVGVMLVEMEVLNDFGTVDFFAVQTFTAGIYDVWLNMNSRSGAAQLATAMLLVVILIIAIERLARRGQRYHHTSTRYQNLPEFELKGWHGWAATGLCLIPIALGFLLPAAVLGRYALTHWREAFEANFLATAFNSLSLSAGAALLAVAVGLFLAYGRRLHGGYIVRGATRLASVGYAIPGAVLAVGVIVPLSWGANTLDAFTTGNLGFSVGFLVGGSIFALMYGYLARFLALSFGSIDAGLTKITPSMDGAARTLGKGPWETLKQVHIPLLRGSVLTAAMLVFVDCMKELPMTMILSSFNFRTLATHVHQFASDELLAESSLAALSIVATGIIPVIILSRSIGGSRPGSRGALVKEKQDGTKAV